MTAEKAKELSRIIEQYLLGKEVEIKIMDIWVTVLGMKDFCPINNDFRVKPKPKLIPFTFEDNLLFRDKWIKVKGFTTVCRVLIFGKSEIKISRLASNIKDTFTYSELSFLCEFEDGSPCGKYVTE